MKKNRKKRTWLWKTVLFMLLCFLWPGAIVQAAGKIIGITNERPIVYPQIWGGYDTHYYSAQTEDGTRTAYCLEPNKSQILTGSYTANPASDNHGIRAALYYGYGGPGQSVYVDRQVFENLENYSLDDARYVLTHLAVAYFYNREGAFEGMDIGNIQKSGIYAFVDWLNTQQVPSVNSSFSESELQAYYDRENNRQRTNSICYQSQNADNQITIACPAGVTLHNESTGRTGTGNVTIKANESFYFSAAPDVADSLGAVWSSGQITGEKDGQWEAMITQPQPGRQAAGYGWLNRSSVTPAQFKVRWISFGSIEVQKKDKDTQKTKPQAHGSFQGAVYSVYREKEEYGKIETDQNGYGRLENLPAGTYTVKEIKAPKGYELDPEIHTVVLEPDGNKKTASVVSEEKAVKIKVRLHIQKVDDETGKNVPQGEGSLKGAEYTVYAGEDMETLKKNEAVGRIITDESGKGSLDDLIPGKYYVRETKASAGYFLDQTIYEVVFPSDGTKLEESITSREKPVKSKIKVEKTDKHTGQSAGAGFEFSVTAGEDIKSEDGTVLLKKGGIADKLVTGADGTAETGVLYPGLYIVKEEKAAEYYVNAGKSYEVLLKAEDTSKEETVTVKIENEKTKVKIKKTEEDYPEQVLKDTEFRLYSEKELTPEQIENLKEVQPETGKRMVTNKNGICEAGELLHNTMYYIVETKAPDGYVRDGEVHKFGVDGNGRIEGKPEYSLELTNKAITVEISKIREDGSEKLPGAKLVLYKEDGQQVETWISEEKPHLISGLKEGSYRLEELQAPKGYKKAENLEVKVAYTGEVQKFVMTDAFLKGRIKITKKDSESNENTGKGFRFTVTAAEDIVLPYGTILYEKGSEIECLETDESGTAVSSELFPGKYEIREVQSGEYYAADEEIYETELKITEENQIKDTEVEIKNTKTRLRIVKTDAENGKPLEKVTFAVSRVQDWGEDEKPEKEVIEKHGVTITTDENGEAEFAELKHESRYYLTETAAKEGYILDENIYSFTVDEQGLIEGKQEYLLEIENQPQPEKKAEEPGEKPEEQKEKSEKPKEKLEKIEKPKETEPKPKGKAVKTGDKTALAQWIVIAGWSAGCLVVLAKRRKK